MSGQELSISICVALSERKVMKAFMFSEISIRELLLLLLFSLSCKDNIFVILYRGNSAGLKSHLAASPFINMQKLVFFLVNFSTVKQEL